jgi:two-component system response regulator ArlR
MKLLIIEDEVEIINSVTSYFSKSGALCEIADTFHLAIEKINLYEYDCIILDISLPDGNGLDILRTLKTIKRNTGVIMLSAKNSMDDKINGLQLGADDYLPKPFHLPELHARVTAIVRRLKFDGKNEINIGNITIQQDKNKIFINKVETAFKKKEFDMLLYLLSNKERIISKVSLAEHIWGDNFDKVDSYDFLYAQIKNLRKTLQQYGANHNIQAVYGIGYKFIKE